MEKNSEDEEGQLEEQIERLQEKVESAQSEQKNLFLVIFQVRVLYFTSSMLVSIFVSSLLQKTWWENGLFTASSYLSAENKHSFHASVCLCVPLWYLSTRTKCLELREHKRAVFISPSPSALYYVTDGTPGSLRDQQHRHQHPLVQELHREATADLPHGNFHPHVRSRASRSHKSSWLTSVSLFFTASRDHPAVRGHLGEPAVHGWAWPSHPGCVSAVLRSAALSSHNASLSTCLFVVHVLFQG